MEIDAAAMLNCRAGWGWDRVGGEMLQQFLMRTALSVMSATLGGFGIFCLAYSFSDPSLAAHALILLGTATAIVYFSG
jgi:hypothetical protein